jgi:hypothetical protein
MFNDSRFYTAKIPLFENKIQSVNFQSVTTLKMKVELLLAIGIQLLAPQQIRDIRFNPNTNTLLWSSEGARVVTGEKQILQNPSLNFMDLKEIF